MNIEKKLGFDVIKEKLAKNILSKPGLSKINTINFSSDKKTIEKKLCETAEFVEILGNEQFPLDIIADLQPVIERISNIKDSYLVIEEIQQISNTLKTLKSVLNFFKNEEKRELYPYLTKLSYPIKFFPIIMNFIDSIMTKDGEIKNSASKELKRIRDDLNRKEKQITSILKKVFVNAQKAGITVDESNITIRNGKMLIPVKSANKNKIKGIVQDYSSTGQTAYIEPLESVELNNEINELYFAEKREIIKILIKFTNDILPYTDDILKAVDFLGELDFIRAKAILARDLDSKKPKILESSEIHLRQALHPLLIWSFRGSKRKIVPLDIDLVENQRIILISGPNAGGKSIAIKTVGLIQYMTQCGFLTPVRKNSKIGIFNNIFVDIGDDQSIENDLSTYSSHLSNMKEMIEKANENDLVLIDEFGSGTDPTLGGAFAETILEELLEKKIRGVINTHYSNLKHFAAQNKGIVNAAMIFDNENLKPLYLLETGRPGSSYAFEIAKNIGLSDKIINKAKQKLDKNAVKFDKIITELELESRKLKSEKQHVERLKKELTKYVLQYREEKEKILNERKKIIDKAEKDAKEQLSEINKLIENTVREIRTKKPEKDELREIRKKAEAQKNKMLKKLEEEKEKLNKEKQKLEKKRRKEHKKDTSINKGDTVKVIKSGLSGTVEEIKDQTAMILIGQMRTFIPLKELEKTKAAQKQKPKTKVHIELNEDSNKSFVFGIDVRGKSADEALQKISKYIDNAIVSEANEIKILHGTGNGILRQVIREYLRKIDEIEWFGDEDIRMGGAGITIVKFKK